MLQPPATAQQLASTSISRIGSSPADCQGGDELKPEASWRRFWASVGCGARSDPPAQCRRLRHDQTKSRCHRDQPDAGRGAGTVRDARRARGLGCAIGGRGRRRGRGRRSRALSRGCAGCAMTTSPGSSGTISFMIMYARSAGASGSARKSGACGWPCSLFAALCPDPCRAGNRGHEHELSSKRFAAAVASRRRP